MCLVRTHEVIQPLLKWVEVAARQTPHRGVNVNMRPENMHLDTCGLLRATASKWPAIKWTHSRSSSWPQQRSSLHPCLVRCSQSRCWSGWSWWNTEMWYRRSPCWVHPPSDPTLKCWTGTASQQIPRAGTTSCLSSRCWCPRQSPRSLQCCTRCRPASALRDQRRRPKEPAQQHHTQYSGPVFWPLDPGEEGGQLWGNWRDCWSPRDE